MLEQIFLKVAEMSLAASVIIVLVMIARVLLKRFPKYLSYMLWSVVLFRLLCPVALEARFSPVPDVGTVIYEYTEGFRFAPGKDADLSEGFTVPSMHHGAEDIAEAGQVAPEQHFPQESGGVAKVPWRERFILLAAYVWIAGISILFLYSVISVVRIRVKVSASIPLRDSIYITDEAISPFVMGIFRPRIYLPGDLERREQRYIILHERFHIRRLDHIVKLVAYAALCVHWFNPLVWVAFALFCKDMEMSCDEAVIKRFGEKVRADYSTSLLALSAQNRFIHGIPVAFGEGATKTRIKNLAAFRKTRKWVAVILSVGVVIFVLCFAFNHKSLITDANTSDSEITVAENQEAKENPDKPDGIKELPRLNLSMNIADYYITNTGYPSNYYTIDEDGVLWGCGENKCGQLGQGTQDYEFHSELAKIAEHVIHVDYSQKGFIIFLTDDHKLYGVGNAGCGALQQYDSFDWERYSSANPERYCVNEPILLMEDVAYARCGRDDIVCMTEDGGVWTWGTVWVQGEYLPPGYVTSAATNFGTYFIQYPVKILENAVLVTGGWNNHAALLKDGTVWTWGYNTAGNCGVAEPEVLSEPVMVAEDVVMVWTGSLTYNTECRDITEFDEIVPRPLNNTIIQKADGSRWICGENVGTEERVVHGAECDYTAICTHEFQPYEG